MSCIADEIARKKARLAELRKAKEQRPSLPSKSVSSGTSLGASAGVAPVAAADLNLKNLLSAAGSETLIKTSTVEHNDHPTSLLKNSF